MAETLLITKKSTKTWLHQPSDELQFIIGKFTFSIDGDFFQIVELGQSKRNKYNFADITVYDETTDTTYDSFTSIVDLSTTLETLSYPAFLRDGDATGVISVNGLTGVVVLNGGNIDVTDPVDSTTKELNDALANIYASGGDTPDLQAVTDVNLNVDGYAETTNGIQTSKLIAENFKVDSALEYFDFGGATPNFHYTPSSGLNVQDDTQENAVTLFQSGIIQFSKNNNSTELEPTATTSRLLFLPDKDGTLATTDDIPTLDATPTNGSTNGVESNGVFDALALKADKSTTRQIIRSKNNGTFGSHTGNTAETVLFTIPINGGEFEIGDWMDFMFQFERLVTGTTINVRLRAGTNGNTSDPQIALLTMVSATLEGAIKRERFEFNTGNILKGASNVFSSAQTDIALITSARTSTSLNPANNWILTVTVTLGSSSDTVICTGYQIGKTKTF